MTDNASRTLPIKTIQSRSGGATGIVSLALSLGALAYFTLPLAKFQQSDPDQHREPPGAGRRGGAMEIPVATTPAVRGDIPIHLDGLGTVSPLNVVTVRSRVEGELIRVAFSEGQTVTKGELLAEIDPRPFEAQLAQAEGQLARDQALLDNARTDLTRYEGLLQEDSIATQQVTGQRALVRQYEAALRVDQGQIAAIKLQLSYCRITAPLTGRVGLRLVDPGNIVHANDAGGLVVIAQTQPIAAVFTLPEDQLPAVTAQLRSHPDIATEAYDRSGSTLLAKGRLLAIDSQIDPATGTIKLKAIFPNDDGSLFANQFVNVRMNLTPIRDATLIPTSALQHGSAGDFAYVVSDGKVKLRPLRTGAQDAERIAVLDGLAIGDQVVVDGVDRLRDGAAVRVIGPEPDAAGEPKAAAPGPTAATRRGRKP